MLADVYELREALADQAFLFAENAIVGWSPIKPYATAEALRNLTLQIAFNWHSTYDDRR